MQSGNIKGTFLMSPNTPGDGTAPAATYTITGFSVYETNNLNVPLGSMATGEYSQGPMTPYQIVWSGSAVTTWQRNNNGNLLTNGILVSRPNITGYELHFGTNFQQANVPNTTYFTSNVTPTLSPAPSTGLCAGQVAPTPSPSPSPSSSSSTSQQTLANTGTQFPLFAGIAALMAGAAMLVLRRRSN
jgi:LPXTG-motif cell wall-anchored protein